MPSFQLQSGYNHKSLWGRPSGQSVNPEPEPKAAAESALAAPTAQFTFKADEHIPGRP